MALIPITNVVNGNTIQASDITNIIKSLDGTGSFSIDATGSFTGSFVGSHTGSFTGSLQGSASTASYSTTLGATLAASTTNFISLISSNGNILSTLTNFTSSYALSSSVAVSSSYALSSSVAVSSSYALSSSTAVSSSYALSSSVAVSSSYALSSSFAVSSSYALSSSFAVSSSYALSSSFAESSSYALSSSYAYFSSTTLPAGPTMAVQFSAGSVLDGFSTFTFDRTGGGLGSILFLTGSLKISGSITSSLQGTSSYALQALTSSYVLSSSFAESSSYALQALTSSYALSSSVAESSSYALSSSIAVSSSYALSASTATFSSTTSPAGSTTAVQFNAGSVLGGNSNFTFTLGGAGTPTVLALTGSLQVSGSITGSNNTVVNFSNLGSGATAGKLVIPTQEPTSPVHGTMYMFAPGAGNVTLFIYNASGSAFRSVTLT
jgi:mucin-3/17